MVMRVESSGLWACSRGEDYSTKVLGGQYLHVYTKSPTR
jgi:hypothetical protein